jgi:hypothetical protein
MKKLLLVLVLAAPLAVRAQTGDAIVQPASDTKSKNGTNDSKNKNDTNDSDTDQGVSLLLGIGSRVGGPGVTNYKTTSANVLEATNLGQATPQALAGLGFPLCGLGGGSNPQESEKSSEKAPASFCGNRLGKRLGVFVSAQFGTGGDSALTGFTVGGSIHVSKALHFLAGFSMNPISEPAPGFRIAASQYVSAHAGQYPGINPAALAANNPDAFDGFQYVIPPPAGSSAPGTPIYPGDVLTTHYRGGFFIGVAFPLSLKSELSGSGKN